MKKHIYRLSVNDTDQVADDIPDELFLERGKAYTIEEFLYNLNRDFIDVQNYWFRYFSRYVRYWEEKN